MTSSSTPSSVHKKQEIGQEAQNRLRNSSVLLVGLSGLGAEVAKNLMLSGLKSLTIMDDKNVVESDFVSQFLISPNSISQNRAEASKHKTHVLNPMVELNVLTESLDAKPDEFFERFQLVILIDQKYDLTNKVNKICRKKGIRFHAGGVFGCTGFAFFDCNNHSFLLPKPKEHSTLDLDDSGDDCGLSSKKRKLEDAPTSVTTVEDDEQQKIQQTSGTKLRLSSSKKRKLEDAPTSVTTVEDDEEQKIQQKVTFSSYESAFNVDWSVKQKIIPSAYFPIRALLRISNEKEHFTADELFEQYKKEVSAAKLEDSSKILDAENFTFFLSPHSSPVCAIVGSMIGQGAIKALSQNDVPLKDIFIYSALDISGIVYEELFKNRYSAEDEEYAKGASVEATEPVVMVPWNTMGGRGSFVPRPDNRYRRFRV